MDRSLNTDKAYSYHLYGSGDDGLVTIVLTVPVNSLNTFLSFMDHRCRVDQAPTKVLTAAYKRKNDLYYSKVCELVIASYDSFAVSGLPDNVSISRTLARVKPLYPNVSTDLIRSIVSKEKRSRKLLQKQ